MKYTMRQITANSFDVLSARVKVGSVRRTAFGAYVCTLHNGNYRADGLTATEAFNAAVTKLANAHARDNGYPDHETMIREVAARKARFAAALGVTVRNGKFAVR